MSVIRKAGAWAGAILLLAIACVALSYLVAVARVASAPASVISATMNANNIIANYEFFHEADGVISARVRQIAGHRKIMTENADNAEKARLRIELAGMQQSCRDLVAKYNARADMSNRSIFMGRDVPASINISVCE